MEDIDVYRRQSRVTDPGARAALFTGLPAAPAALALLIGGVVVHRDWSARFGFTLPPERRAEADTRYVEAILTHVGTLRSRPPEERFAGTCRDFTVLLCAMLRHAGVPARARVGFAGYSTPGDHVDHWVAEVWDDASGWRLIDAQLAGTPDIHADLDVDPLDVPRDAFLVGGRAWRECRSGARDPGRFGLPALGLTGMWEVQGNVLRDLAALNRVETLPWDDYGLIPTHFDRLSPEELALLDTVAEVSAAGGPAGRAAEVYRSDPRRLAPASP